VKKRFDAVKTMRAIRDRMSREMKGLSPREQIKYIERKSRPGRKGEKPAVAANNRSLTR